MSPGRKNSSSTEGRNGAEGVDQPLILHRTRGTFVAVARGFANVISPLVLSLIYFLVVSPMALVIRMTGRDAMHRHFDAAAGTYRTASVDRPAEDLENPY